MREQQQDNRGTAKLALALVLGCVAVVFAWMWLSRTPVKLDEDQYDVAIALYRICNQKSDEGIETIEKLLLENNALADPELPSARAIQEIILDAKQQRWEQASQNCRVLLEDQIEY